MSRAGSLADPAAALDALRASPEALPWPERRDLARSLGERLRDEHPPPWLGPLAAALAADPKPEVRQAIANSLHLFDEKSLARLGAKLSEDSNAFVRKAAERSLDRRRRGQRSAEQERRKVEQVQTEFDAIARLHGEAAAEKAQAMAERFADVVVGSTAHNLGGVITSLKLKAEAVTRELNSDAPDLQAARSAAGVISERIAFLERLVGDMTEYARPLSNQRRRERLTAIVEEAHRLALDATRIDKGTLGSVQYACAVPEAITVDVVRHQMMMAIVNVLKNAYEALADAEGALRPGSVTVTAEARGCEVTIIVADTGGGLEARDLAELREFVPGRTSKKNRGTGFGLPIARRIAAAHGGALVIDSEWGRGTTVTIRLPLEHGEADL